MELRWISGHNSLFHITTLSHITTFTPSESSYITLIQSFTQLSKCKFSQHNPRILHPFPPGVDLRKSLRSNSIHHISRSHNSIWKLPGSYRSYSDAIDLTRKSLSVTPDPLAFLAFPIAPIPPGGGYRLVSQNFHRANRSSCVVDRVYSSDVGGRGGARGSIYIPELPVLVSCRLYEQIFSFSHSEIDSPQGMYREGTTYQPM